MNILVFGLPAITALPFATDNYGSGSFANGGDGNDYPASYVSSVGGGGGGGYYGGGGGLMLGGGGGSSYSSGTILANVKGANTGSGRVNITLISEESVAPTADPTLLPTAEPMPTQTSQPTTAHPSATPTSPPSALPTFTLIPTELPTAQPSVAPSMPTFTPTAVPSAAPTTASPQIPPSPVPSIAPSFQPSFEPSATPTTSAPSHTPTASPTAAPTTASPTPAPTPRNCAAGQYSGGGGDCSNCPAGTFTATNGSFWCEDCGIGYYSGEGASSCSSYAQTSTPEACEQGTYNSKQGSTNSSDCALCPLGRISPGEGTTTDADCLSPATNFITSIVCLLLAGYIAWRYILFSGLNRIAFLRKERLVYRLVAICRELHQWVDDISRTPMPPQGEGLKSEAKMALFLLGSAILVVLCTCIFFLLAIMVILYHALILWRGISVHWQVPYIARINDLLAELGLQISVFIPDIDIPIAIRSVFYPFTWLVDELSRINLILDTLRVTCAGAQAPIELLINCLILGFVVLAIDSDYQLAWVNAIGGVMLKFLALMLNRKMITHLRIKSNTQYGHYFAKCLTLAVLVFTANPFQAVLQYLMGFVTIGKFAEESHGHATTQACNEVAGYIDYDFKLAVAASLLAFFVFQSALYLLAKILSPKLPEWARVEVNGFNAPRKAPQGAFFMGSWLKYPAQLLSGDLYIAFLANTCVQMLSRIVNCPTEPLAVFKTMIRAETTDRDEEAENQRWEAHQKDKLPIYLDLALAVSRSLQTSTGVPSQLLFIPALVPVQLCTREGRLAWYLVIWSLFAFALTALGVWVDDDFYDVFDFESAVASTHPIGPFEHHHADDPYKEVRFSQAVAAMVGMRAILLQVSSYFTVLSVYCIQTPACPVFSDKLATHLPPLFINNVMAFARRRENALDCQWTLPLRAINIFVAESRAIQYVFNTFKFIMALSLLYSSSLDKVVISLIVILLPVAFVNSLLVVVYFGKSVVGLRDADFVKVFGANWCASLAGEGDDKMQHCKTSITVGDSEYELVIAGTANQDEESGGDETDEVGGGCGRLGYAMAEGAVEGEEEAEKMFPLPCEELMPPSAPPPPAAGFALKGADFQFNTTAAAGASYHPQSCDAMFDYFLEDCKENNVDM